MVQVISIDVIFAPNERITNEKHTNHSHTFKVKHITSDATRSK